MAWCVLECIVLYCLLTSFFPKFPWSLPLTIIKSLPKSKFFYPPQNSKNFNPSPSPSINLYIKATEDKLKTFNTCGSLVSSEIKLKSLSGYQNNDGKKLMFRSQFHIAWWSISELKCLEPLTTAKLNSDES